MTLKQQKGFAVTTPYGPPELICMCTGYFLFVGHFSFARSCAITGGHPAWRWRWHPGFGRQPHRLPLTTCDSERDSHPFLPVKPKRGSGCPPGPGKDAMCGGGPRTRRALSEYQPLSLLGLFPVFLCHLHFYFHHRDIPPSRCPTLQNCSLMEGELSSLHRVMCKLALVFPLGRFQL